MPRNSAEKGGDMTHRELLCEAVLKRWKAIQAEVKAAEDDAANVAFSQGSGEPVQSSNISDKTYRGAAMLEKVEEKREWVACVSKSMDWMKQEKPDIYRLLYGHYGMRYTKGYRRKFAREFTVAYCRTYHISESEYKSRRYEGLAELAYDATEAGLIKKYSSQT